MGDLRDIRGHRAAVIRGGKGGKTRTVALPPTLHRAITEHLDGREDGPVFVGRAGGAP